MKYLFLLLLLVSPITASANGGYIDAGMSINHLNYWNHRKGDIDRYWEEIDRRFKGNTNFESCIIRIKWSGGRKFTCRACGLMSVRAKAPVMEYPTRCMPGDQRPF